MATEMLTTLANVLLEVDELPWEYALYIPESSPSWLQDMSVMVLDPEHTDDPDDDPDEAKKNGLRYALTIGNLQDVVENARAQDASVDLDVLTKALKYYCDNDAFVTLK